MNAPTMSRKTFAPSLASFAGQFFRGRASQDKSPFAEQAKSFEAFLDDALECEFPPTPGSPLCGIIITPWVETAVPWFSLTLGLLYRKLGYRVAFIYHDTTFPNRNEPVSQLAIIKRVLNRFAPRFEILSLSSFAPQHCDKILSVELDKLVHLNMGTYLRRTPQDFSPEELQAKCASAMREAAGSLLALFETRRFDHVVAPGGLYGFSGLYRVISDRYDTRTAYYDSGTGSLVLGSDNVAGHCMDLGKAFSPEYQDFLKENSEIMIALAKAEMAQRVTAGDRYSYQEAAMNPKDRELGGDILIPLSIFDDAAGIGKTQSFASSAEWIEETVNWILTKTDASVVMREHPSTRKVKTNRDLQLRLAEQHKGNPRFRFIAGTETVNTYALMPRAKIVLPCASTVGVEAAAMGKHVIMESSAYYAGLSFVTFALTKEDYFAQITKALANPEPLSQSQRNDAWTCYFLGQVANFVDGDFTPIPSDFSSWVARKFEELAADPKIQLVVEVLAEGVPSCIVQGKRILTEQRYDKTEVMELAAKTDQFLAQN
ncbi:MAG: hypothetical protein ABIP97_10730 [Chthoniobacterales bacterium]